MQFTIRKFADVAALAEQLTNVGCQVMIEKIEEYPGYMLVCTENNGGRFDIITPEESFLLEDKRAEEKESQAIHTVKNLIDEGFLAAQDFFKTVIKKK